MKLTSLLKRNNKLADTAEQLKYLNGAIFQKGELPYFNEKLKAFQKFPLKPSEIEILQINLGYMCNQVCAHCHVDAGPDRKEIMTKENLNYCLNVIESCKIKTIDLTGGAPEMNPNFRWFVEEASKIGVNDLIVRSNLTILKANKSYNDLPEFFKKYNVHVISSMPHWTKGKTDKQRGDGVFEKSIKALIDLNNVGYGKSDTNLKLDLVYNPSGAFLPSNQKDLEKEFKKVLFEKFGISFNNLFAITNLPVSRFLEYLIKSDNYEDYMHKLVESFNPNAADQVMCKNTISVGWDGNLYDCDFNQMLNLQINSPHNHIANFNPEKLSQRDITISQHCYGCTAGAGSSCQGTTT